MGRNCPNRDSTGGDLREFTFSCLSVYISTVPRISVIGHKITMNHIKFPIKKVCESIKKKWKLYF